MDNPIPYEADDYYEGDDRTPDQLEIDGLWQEIHSLRAQLENNKKAKAIRRKTIATLMAENKSLRQELDEAREIGWLWDKMGENRISHISLNYGMGMIGAFDFDGNDIAEAETLTRLFELIEQHTGGEPGMTLTEKLILTDYKSRGGA